MHTRAECRARINVQNLLIPVFLLHFLPRGNHEKIVYVKLVEILFPVIDPVDILRLGHRDGSFPDAHKQADLRQRLLNSQKHALFVRLLSAEVKHPALLFLHEKAEIRRAVIGLALRQDIHKHLLFFQRRKGHFVLDLRPLKPSVVEFADNDILRLHDRLYLEFHPLHGSIYFLSLSSKSFVFNSFSITRISSSATFLFSLPSA